MCISPQPTKPLRQDFALASFAHPWKDSLGHGGPSGGGWVRKTAFAPLNEALPSPWEQVGLALNESSTESNLF